MDDAYMAYRELRIAENKKRRLKTVRRQRMILGIVIALFIALFTFLSVALLTKANAEDIRYKYYTTVTIGCGDTLETIAGNYISDEYRDMSSYICEVQSINHIEDKDVIHAGDNIIVPYYSSEFK